MAALGTWRWVEQTGGKLSLRDRLVFIAHGVAARAKTRFGGKLLAAARHLTLDDILPPDSAACNAAAALSAEASKPYLFNHCMRAYFWARIMNGPEKFDDEAFFVAIMLHDLGLTDRYRLEGGAVQCFTLPAARIANQLALDHGWTEQRAEVTANAIALHLNIAIPARHGREAQLVRMGSGADVAGLGMAMMTPQQQAQILVQFPRLQMKKQIARDLSIEAKERPCCRIAFLIKPLGFNALIRNALFSE